MILLTSTLSKELAEDPSGLGLSGKLSASELATLLNEKQVVSRKVGALPVLTAREALGVNAFAAVIDAAAAAEEKGHAAAVMVAECLRHDDAVDLAEGAVFRTALDELAAAGVLESKLIEELVSAATIDQEASRAEEIFGPGIVVTPADITRAFK